MTIRMVSTGASTLGVAGTCFSMSDSISRLLCRRRRGEVAYRATKSWKEVSLLNHSPTSSQTWRSTTFIVRRGCMSVP